MLRKHYSFMTLLEVYGLYIEYLLFLQNENIIMNSMVLLIFGKCFYKNIDKKNICLISLKLYLGEKNYSGSVAAKVRNIPNCF